MYFEHLIQCRWFLRIQTLEILNGLYQTILQIHLGLPTQLRFGQLNVGLALLGVVLRQRHKTQLAL